MMFLKDYILHQVREMKRELLVVLDGLGEQDMTSYESGEQTCIAWIVQHCCANVDFFIHKGSTGDFFLSHEQRFLTWPLIDPTPEDVYPPREELIHRWTGLCDAGVRALESLPEEDVQAPSKSADPGEPLVESCLRVVNHQNVHLRQIWCILGRRHIDKKWPVHETWLA